MFLFWPVYHTTTEVVEVEKKVEVPVCSSCWQPLHMKTAVVTAYSGPYNPYEVHNCPSAGYLKHGSQIISPEE